MVYAVDGSTVLVTGGAGLIGSHVVDRLIDAGAGEIRVLDDQSRGRPANLAAAQARQRVQVFEGDVSDPVLVDRCTEGCDYVFHLAGPRVTRAADRPRDCLDVTAAGAVNVFEAAVRADVKKVVYASSAAVYGAADTFPTPEGHHPYNCRSLDGAAKLFVEGMARHFFDAHGLASVGLRYFNVYGPRMDATGAWSEVVVRWLAAAERGVPPQIHGTGKATLDLVYVTDAARANLLALRADRGDLVCNVGSGIETALLDLWRLIQRVVGGTRVAPDFLPPRPGHGVSRRSADVRRARDELGFTAEVPLQEGLRRLAAWWRETQVLDELAL